MRNRLVVGSAIALLAILLLAIAALSWVGAFRPPGPVNFEGARAYDHVLSQMEIGPRITGTAGGAAAAEYIAAELDAAGWAVEFQPFVYQGVEARNVVARANVGEGPVVILGAHYDTRRRADQDLNQPNEPVPGANDGASGVAVLLELARTLDLNAVPNEIWLAFFDAEDNGRLDGWDWIAGSTYMAANLTVEPEAMILVDMVGDADQQMYFDNNSDAALSARVWTVAAQLGYGDYFIPLPKFTMLDDHIPFRDRGIPAIDIIDFDYPYWHTTQDTADKVSAQSLERVGRTLEAFLEEHDE
jgi:hypothetical protein